MDPYLIHGGQKAVVITKYSAFLCHSVKESKEADSEVYSTKKFVKALSFRIGLVASVVVLVVLVVIVAIVAGVIVGTWWEPAVGMERRVNAAYFPMQVMLPRIVLS